MATPKWDEIFKKSTEQLLRMMNDYKNDIERGYDQVDTGKPFTVSHKTVLTGEDDGGVDVATHISFAPATKIEDHINAKVGGKQLDLPIGN
jgi:hypothetical protein